MHRATRIPVALALLLSASAAAAGTLASQEPDAPAGADRPLIDRVRELGVDSVVSGVAVYFTPGNRQRAEELGLMAAEAVAFFEDSLGVARDLRLALLEEEDWTRVAPYPYGLPFVNSDGDLSLAMLPPAGDGIVYESVVAVKETLSPELRARVAALGLTWDGLARQMVDLIGFHEIGHAYTGAFGIEPPTRWLSEFMASYFAYAYMHARHPELAEAWDISGHAILEGHDPEHRTLEEFERLYAGVGVEDYAWYQSAFEQRANPLVEERGLEFIRQVREAFPVGTGPLPTEEVLRRLEAIAPGFLEWAEIFER